MECKKTLCRVCSFGCLMDAWVEDGVVCRVSPDQDTPTSRKFLCAKGYATRPYVYHKDRILTPLRWGSGAKDALNPSPGMKPWTLWPKG